MESLSLSSVSGDVRLGAGGEGSFAVGVGIGCLVAVLRCVKGCYWSEGKTRSSASHTGTSRHLAFAVITREAPEVSAQPISAYRTPPNVGPRKSHGRPTAKTLPRHQPTHAP